VGFFIWRNDSSFFSLKGVETNKKSSIAFFWQCVGFYACTEFRLGSMKLIPLSPQKETHDESCGFFLFGAATQVPSGGKVIMSKSCGISKLFKIY
jgi:hypothetical protein